MEDKQQQQIDRYIIRRVLGTGAMGSVYAAWDPKLHREVALKVVPSRLSAESKGRERFQREARAIAAVRHPNIVEIYDYSGTDSEYLYLVIEKLDGEDLYATMHRRGLMGEAVAAAVGHELCLALQVAHDAGIVHRDLKPENVFLNSTGRVVLTDFGIVKAVRGDSAVDGYKENTDVIGTPGFMAPELMSGRGLGPPIDIFALGALLYNITTNRLPFEGATPLAIFQAATAGKYEDPRKHNPTLSEEFCAVIASCLQPNPRKRPRSAEMVRLALKTVIEDCGVNDVRDDLHDFMKNTEAYKQRTQARAVRHLVQSVKIAVKDHDQTQITRLRKRLMVIDPHNDDLREVSGIIQVQGRERNKHPLQALSLMATRVTRFMHGGVDTVQQLNRSAPRLFYGAGVVMLLALVGIGVKFMHTPVADVQTPVAARVWPGASHVPRMADYQRMAEYETSVPAEAYPMPKAPGAAVLPEPGQLVGTPAEPTAAMSSPAPSMPFAARDVPAAHPAPRSAWVEVRVLGGGANLVVDGQALGRSSHKSVQMVPGRHVVEVVRRGRHLRRVITLAGGDRIALRVDIKHQKMNVQ